MDHAKVCHDSSVSLVSVEVHLSQIVIRETKPLRQAQIIVGWENWLL